MTEAKLDPKTEQRNSSMDSLIYRRIQDREQLLKAKNRAMQSSRVVDNPLADSMVGFMSVESCDLRNNSLFSLLYKKAFLRTIL